MFLDDDQLKHLTGYAQKAKQVAQLRRMGVPFFVNAAGKPVVAESAVQGTKPQETIQTQVSWEPSWAANHP